MIKQSFWIGVLLVAALPAGFQEYALAQQALTENTVGLIDGRASPAAGIEDVAWLAGYWRGEALGGIAEEIWSPPLGGSMMGVFRLFRNGAVSFYEILAITPEDESLTLRLKHFHPDLTGWEEKDEVVTFPLVKLEDRSAYFSGMTFRMLNPDSLEIYVAMQQQDGTHREGAFRLERVEGWE